MGEIHQLLSPCFQPCNRAFLTLPSDCFVVSNLYNSTKNIPIMKLAIASLVLGSAAAFQPHTALNAVPQSSSALDMKVRWD